MSDDIHIDLACSIHRSEVDMQKALDIAAVALAALLVVGLAVVSVRGLIDPQQASLRFGFPVSDAAGALFYRVYLSRNLVIVAASAVFLIRRQWTPLAILLSAAAVLPVFDMTVLSVDGVTPPAFHKLALVLLAIAAALLWRLSRVSRA
jgi:Domain of unknown function (DUF4267)